MDIEIAMRYKGSYYKTIEGKCCNDCSLYSLDYYCFGESFCDKLKNLSGDFSWHYIGKSKDHTTGILLKYAGEYYECVPREQEACYGLCDAYNRDLCEQKAGRGGDAICKTLKTIHGSYRTCFKIIKEIP